MYDLFQHSPDIISSISQSYQRTETSLNEDIATLKQWMTTQHHLPEVLDDKSLQNFLILNKCSVEKAKERIDMYYSLRSRLPEMYEKINPKKLTEVMKTVCWVPLPKLTKDNHRVLFFKLNRGDVGELEPRDVLSVASCIQEVRLKEDVMFGDVFVYDMQGLTLGYLVKLTPSFIAKVFAIYMKVFSIPMKGFFVINSSSYVTTLLAIIKTIMKPKLFSRIHVCEDASILHERFPKEMLPRDYGGEELSTGELQELLQVKFQQYQTRFDQLEELKVDEKLRPEKLDNDEVLGFHGNFKKLNVD